MRYEVAKGFRDGDRDLKPGDVVEADGWRNRDRLLHARFIRPLEADPVDAITRRKFTSGSIEDAPSGSEQSLSIEGRLVTLERTLAEIKEVVMVASAPKKRRSRKGTGV